MTDDILFPGLLRNNHRSSFYINLDIGDDMVIASLKIGMDVSKLSIVCYYISYKMQYWLFFILDVFMLYSLDIFEYNNAIHKF